MSKNGTAALVHDLVRPPPFPPTYTKKHTHTLVVHRDALRWPPQNIKLAKQRKVLNSLIKEVKSQEDSTYRWWASRTYTLREVSNRAHPRHAALTGAPPHVLAAQVPHFGRAYGKQHVGRGHGLYRQLVDLRHLTGGRQVRCRAPPHPTHHAVVPFALVRSVG